MSRTLSTDACLWVNPLDEADKLSSVRQSLGMGHPWQSRPTGHVTANSKDVVDPGLGIVSDHLLQICHRLGNASEMTDGTQTGRHHVLGAPQSAVTPRPIRSIGH